MRRERLKRQWTMTILLLLAIVALLATILLAMGRPPICTCGEVKLWTGAVQSADNSQHIADWYTPSHIIHGLIFYAIAHLALRRWPLRARAIVAALVEAAWEVVENSQPIIDRYREATFAFGYNGDSVLNSDADLGWMLAGFALAARLPVWASIALAVTFELVAAAVIRDNLALNILMLVSPIEAMKIWQGGA
jgi:hypothetical protein